MDGHPLLLFSDPSVVKPCNTCDFREQATFGEGWPPLLLSLRGFLLMLPGPSAVQRSIGKLIGHMLRSLNRTCNLLEKPSKQV